MSYEKLKISVAVSLVLFIFIVGNIFAFGYLQKTYEAHQLKDKLQNTQTDLNTILDIKKDRNEVTPSPKTVTKEESKDTPTSSETTTQTTITHRRRHRRTRAS